MRLAVIFVSLAIAVAADAGETVDLIVAFRRPAIEELRRDLARLESHRGIAQNADEHPATITHTFSRVLQGAGIRVRRELRGAIEDLPYVASVHVARTFEPLLYRSVAHIHADRVWDRDRTRGAGVTVAVIDSGIDYRHAAFGERFGPGAKVIGGWDFVNDDGDPMDDHGHGTHVAGIIGAAGGGLVGVAPTASLLAYKVLDANGRGAEADIIAAIERAVDPNQDGDLSDHADIVNISLGASAVENDPLVNALENATAAGVLFVVSAGNDGQRRPGGNYGDILTPAIAPSALSVGAAGIDDRVAQFSSRGPSYTYAIKPEIVAPGVDIVSAKRNGGAVGASGTSMAAPHVAGVAALIKSLHRDWTPEEVKAAIVGTTRSLAEDVMMAGAGRVDALDAASATTLAMPPVVNFGQVDASDVVWRSSQSFLLRNVSTTTQALTSSVSGLREGLIVRTVPSSLTLEPGQAKRIKVEIEVTNHSVPAARTGSRSYEGQIVWNGGAVPIRLPWAFVKAAFLTIGERDGNEVQAVVIGESEKFTTRVFLGRNRVFWSLENVDVVVTKSGTPERMAVVEQVAIEGSPLAAVAVDDAALTVTAVTTDENGGPLRRPGRDCAEGLVLSFPQGKKVAARNETRFTRLSSRIRIYVLNHCADVARGTIHAALHEPIQGLERDIISTMQPQWLRQDVRFVPDVVGPATTALPRMRFPGPESQFFVDEGSPWRGLPSNMTILFTPSPGPEVDLMLELGREDIDRVRLYLSERSVKSDSDLFLEISPMAYELPVGTAMIFGPPAMSPQVQLFSVDPLVAQAVWFGPFGERRPRDNPKLVVSQLPPGAWRIESRNGSATYIGVADTTKSDPFLPLFTGLRIANGSLLFSIIDVAPGGWRVEPREAMTRVDYRASGANEWRPLFPQVVARQYLYNSLFPPGIGTMYRVDLSHLRGSIDLRVHAEDEAGNTIELRLEPALTASGPTRRRAVGR